MLVIQDYFIFVLSFTQKSYTMKYILIFAATWFFVWLLFAFIGWLPSEMTYWQCLGDAWTIALTVILGWIPSHLIAEDADTPKRTF